MAPLAIPDGERLTAEEYIEQFAADFWRSAPSGVWKLQRRQSFREPDSESWCAFARGEWDRAIHRVGYLRSQLTDYYRKIGANRFSTRQVRIVERPITPYVQWESHLLRLRDELGGAVHVLGADQVAEHETDGLLPEIVVLGKVMYQIFYDDTGLLAGAVRCTNGETVGEWRKLITGLFYRGEPIGPFFDREIAALPPVEVPQWR